MLRLLFQKTGNAVWISHLDLMRVFQRAFKRAGLPLKHTQGFNPRPSVSIALPLSVGVESQCELLDFDLDGESVPYEDIKTRLNVSLVYGISVLNVYEAARAIKHISFLDCSLKLEYDRLIEQSAAERIRALFAQDSIVVNKKSKNGITEQDIIPMIHQISVEFLNNHELEIKASVSCMNPALNPMQIHAAIEKYLPDLSADYVRCSRSEIYDNTNTIFR